MKSKMKCKLNKERDLGMTKRRKEVTNKTTNIEYIDPIICKDTKDYDYNLLTNCTWTINLYQNDYEKLIN